MRKYCFKHAVIRLVSVMCSLSLVGDVIAADAEAGKKVFMQCVGCHMVGPDAQHRFGPHLNGIVEKAASSAEGYDYSNAFKKAGDDELVWTADTLDAFLKAPMEYMPGTKMAYPGLASAADRINVIAYLETLGDAETSNSIAATKPEGQQESASKQPEQRPLAKDAAIPTHGVLHIGREALPEEIAAWDIDIRPDGQGLPVGGGNAVDGAELYDAQCASCHGVFGEGEGRWPILAGGFDTLADERPEKTIGSYWPYLSTVYDYVRRAMPFGNARSLSDDDVYALTAYLLYLNDLVEEDFELSSDNFASVRLPNEANFFPDSRAQEPGYELTAEPCMKNCMEGIAAVTQRARVLDVTPDTEQ